jgi:rsbT co-antagonist protein RsbR
VHPDDQAATIAETRKLADQGLETIAFENRYRCKDGAYRWLRWSASPDRERGLIYCIERDVTEQHAAAAALEGLSTPLIPLSDTVMVMPLIGLMDSRRAQQVLDTLLHGVANAGAEIAIIDITGVSVVDTQVANVLVRAAQAVTLLDAQVMLTGIRPEVAQTLVGLGAELPIVTRSTLQKGIEYAMSRRKE